MKVCVPSMEIGGLDDYICEHFGRAPTFTVVDLDTGEVEIIPNTSEHMGGIGKPPELIAKAGVDVMICSNLGPKAIAMFRQLGIKVYVGASGKVRDAIRLWQEGRLMEGTEAIACSEHRHGGFGHFC